MKLKGIKINPTPAVGVIGVENISNIRTMDFKNEGDKILLIGKTYDEVEGSEYHRSIYNIEEGQAPKIRIDEEVANGNAILNLISNDNNKNITAVHDCSNGGLGVAIAEMVISSGLGCEIDLDAIITEDKLDINDLIYSETHGRYIITVKSDNVDEILNKVNVPITCIGEVKGNSLKLADTNFSFDELNQAFHGVLEKYMV